jgi:hypothetical protein
MKRAGKAIGIVLGFVLAFNQVSAQSSSDSATRQWVESRNFIFKAQTVFPQGGRSRQLTTEYDLTVSRDTIVSFLPYFGRAFIAPTNPTDGGIKFTSLKFDYNQGKEKKSKWEITIKPNDVTDVRELYLTVFTSGRATLRINSNNRQTISYNGYIVEGPYKEKRAF